VIKTFKVTLEMPYGVSSGDMQAYIETAVRCWKGSLHTDDPMSDLDRHSIEVTYTRRSKKFEVKK